MTGSPGRSSTVMLLRSPRGLCRSDRLSTMALTNGTLTSLTKPDDFSKACVSRSRAAARSTNEARNRVEDVFEDRLLRRLASLRVEVEARAPVFLQACQTHRGFPARRAWVP